MLIMEDKSEEKEKTEDIRTELRDQNQSPDRPRNFSLRRRSDIYYFSDDSERGILKRVPLENGAYKINELETVLDKSGPVKTRTEIWSDVPLNSIENLQSNKNGSATKYDDVHGPVCHDRKREPFLKSRKKIDWYKAQSHGLNNVEGLGDSKNSKTKNECQDAMTINNQEQKEKVILKPCKDIKKQQPTTFAEIDSENLQGSNSDEKCKKFSATNKTSSPSKKSEEVERNNKNLSDSLTVKCLTDALNKILMETPITEL